MMESVEFPGLAEEVARAHRVVCDESRDEGISHLVCLNGAGCGASGCGCEPRQTGLKRSLRGLLGAFTKERDEVLQCPPVILALRKKS